MSRFLSYTAILGLVIALIVLDASWLHFTRSIDAKLGDTLLAQRAPSRPASDDIVIVDVDQNSLTKLMGELGNWPWPRVAFAEMLEGIDAQAPRAVVFDILFNEFDTFRPDSDVAFREAVQRHARSYFSSVLLTDGQGPALRDLPPVLKLITLPGALPNARSPLLLPTLLPRDAWRGGLINFSHEDDGIGRHYLVKETLAPGWQMQSLSARIATDLGWTVPDQHRIRLNWQQQHRHVSFSDIYTDLNIEHPKRPPDEFKNKIVLIGTAAPGLQDLRPTPLSSNFPGIEILATAIDNLQAGDWLRDAPRWVSPVVSVLIAIGLWFGFRRGLNTLWMGLGMIVVSVVIVTASATLLSHNLYWPVGSVLIWGWVYFWLAALMAYLAERLRREQAVNLFGRFLDPRVVKDLVASGQVDDAKRVQSLEITVLFSDIRGFTTLSETRTPEYIVNLLNRYFSRQVAVVFRHGGTLDKLIGDAVMAFWGAPVHDPEHAKHAVAAAIEMGQELEEFKKELTDLGADFDIGIGLHTGRAVVAFIGPENRLSYTVIGDTVNLASRIEGQTKGVARVLVSEATRAACPDAFEFIDHGSHAVKGRAEPVQLFEPKPKSTSVGQQKEQ
ncbi:CHASE2 domain-containing protein [Andreprevotia chitinilytica]|uniref:CHASE2 domain-containing protein n=1 Tax=Andreprevotia chitinilytica TaxID=396808 RepID=UPI001470042E|nr:adenylate/guanylate cyclase domain-containing protein [Andreprevotia chitinilytica]